MKSIKLYYIVSRGKSYGPYAYFKHRSLGRVFTEKEVDALDSLIEVVRRTKSSYIFILFSGGRDSLVALHLACKVGRALGLPVEAVNADTTISTPGNMDYVRSVCEKLKVKLAIVRPRDDFFTLVKKWGFPTVTRRWCCYHLKIEPLKQHFKGKSGLIVDGIRMDESPRRRSFPKLGVHRHFNLPCYHPIFEWSKQDVLNYISRHALPENPLYQRLPRATDCWCTAFKTVKQFKQLKENWPELFEKFLEAESKLRTGGSALFKGKRIYFRDL